MLFAEAHGLTTIPRLQNAVAIAMQKFAQHGTDVLVVLDKQDGFAAARRIALPQSVRGGQRLLLGDLGQMDEEVRPLAGSAVNLDAAAAVLDDLPDNRQTKPCPSTRRPGREARLEQVGLRLGIHAAAGMANAQLDV